MSDKDESFLVTGLGSPKYRELHAQRGEASREKEQQRIQLEPYIEIVNSIIEQELATVSDVNSLEISLDSTEETYKALVLARKMNIQFINTFKTRLINKVREARTK